MAGNILQFWYLDFLISTVHNVIDLLARRRVPNVSSLYVPINIEQVLNPLVSCHDPSLWLEYKRGSATSQVEGGPWLKQETKFGFVGKTRTIFKPVDWF